MNTMPPLRALDPNTVLRTPDARFAGITDFPYQPEYLEVGGLRIAYIDEGPRDAPPVLLMHGEPTWSYLYRKMIPGLLAAGHRVIAPDLVGFGRSDKPMHRQDFSYLHHVQWMAAWMEALDLQNTTLFCQDWGSLIGLRLVTYAPQRFARVCLANGGLPTEPDDPERARNEQAWEVLKQWHKPFLTLFSSRDPVTRGGDKIFLKLVPGTANQPHALTRGAGHFLQEDKGPELAQQLNAWIATT